ncbi:N-acetyltransferase family protein [Rhodovulum sp. DZ06]|uniref:GNAT family N-acetyltransferase n=1 Tax=Rhodovulum sp. DZ06 TaxID=3425126 RepID=UPI003D340B5F
MTPPARPATRPLVRPVIRPVTPGDAPAWAALWAGVQAAVGAAADPAASDAAFARLSDPADAAMHGLIAEADGRALGLAHYLFHDHFWRPEGVTYLSDLYVVPEARGRGVGTALMEAVLAAAEAAGRPSVHWTTQDYNLPAQMFHDRFGTRTALVKYQR